MHSFSDLNGEEERAECLEQGSVAGSVEPSWSRYAVLYAFRYVQPLQGPRAMSVASSLRLRFPVVNMLLEPSSARIAYDAKEALNAKCESLECLNSCKLRSPSQAI